MVLCITAGVIMISSNDAYLLAYQGDGNFVIYAIPAYVRKCIYYVRNSVVYSV